MLIAMAGLPGTGKSALARGLAEALPAVVLDKDTIRAAIFPPVEIEYSTAQDDFCLSIMLQVAAYLLAKDPARQVILDGRPFARAYQRADLLAYTQPRGLPLCFLECTCSEETARRRLTRDVTEAAHLARNRDFALYQTLKDSFEPLQEPRLVVDTDQPFPHCLAACLEYLHARAAEAGHTYSAARDGAP